SMRCSTSPSYWGSFILLLLLVLLLLDQPAPIELPSLLIDDDPRCGQGRWLRFRLVPSDSARRERVLDVLMRLNSGSEMVALPEIHRFERFPRHADDGRTFDHHDGTVLADPRHMIAECAIAQGPAFTSGNGTLFERGVGFGFGLPPSSAFNIGAVDIDASGAQRLAKRIGCRMLPGPPPYLGDGPAHRPAREPELLLAGRRDVQELIAVGDDVVLFRARKVPPGIMTIDRPVEHGARIMGPREPEIDQRRLPIDAVRHDPVRRRSPPRASQNVIAIGRLFGAPAANLAVHQLAGAGGRQFPRLD